MKFPRSASFLCAALLVFLAEKDSCAQWKNVAPNIVSPLNNSGWGYGAIKYQDGKIIAAAFGTPICISSDDGKTWQLVSVQYGKDDVEDVDIFDANNAIIATYQNGLFITHDGGNSWNQTALKISVNAAKYVGSSNDIVAGKNGGKNGQQLVISHDAGNSWAQITSASFIGENDVQVRKKDKSIYALEVSGTGSGNAGHIYSTHDDGLTWIESVATFYDDCYQFALDPCDDNAIYVMNEGSVSPGPDGLGHIFTTYDNGLSFNAINPMQSMYYSGNIIAATGGTLYVQTQTTDGVLRSTDHGRTWKSIGGPSGFADTRLICCKDDNTIFAFDRNGSIWATFNSGGDSLTFAPTGSLSIAPKSVFDLDTIHCNDSIIHSISINHTGCNPTSISSWSITGKDSLSYSAGNLTYDSLHISFAPKTSGNHSASLVLILNDGTSDTITLKGYNNSKSFSYSAFPQSLFGNDSIYICNPQKIQNFILNTGGCLPKIVSQNISGKNANDYGIIKQIDSPLPNLDSVILSFKPNDSGSRNAKYELILDNGTIISIPLQGYGIAPHPLALTTTDQSTDTIGGAINVPITINGLDHTEDIDLVLHYDKELSYHGSYSTTNAPLDIPTIGLSGRSKLHIANAKPNTTLGYAHFDIFNDSLAKSHVTFDSVTVLTAVAQCQYILPASVTSTITPPSGCGIQSISRFMHDSTMPQLSIIPNPTNGETSISSTQNLGDVSITVYDMLGIKQSMNLAILQKNTPTKIILPVMNGVYNVRVLSVERTYDLRVVVNR